MSPPAFYRYGLTADMLCIGERIKRGTFRPTLKTIPFSTIVGALWRTFGGDYDDWIAAGVLDQRNGYCRVQTMVSAPTDAMTGVAKIPLVTEVLTDVRGLVFIKPTPAAEHLPDDFELTLGALRSKGLGRCRLQRMSDVKQSPVQEGSLATRIPDKRLDDFGIEPIAPLYCYLWEPDPNPANLTGGKYVLSLREGSRVAGPQFMIRGHVQ